MSQVIDTRRHPRQETFSAVAFEPEGHGAMALDLSLGGARVGLLDTWRPSRDSVLPMCFLSDTDHAVMLRCRVTRVAVDHIGVAFEPEQDADIRRLLEAARTH